MTRNGQELIEDTKTAIESAQGQTELQKTMIGRIFLVMEAAKGGAKSPQVTANLTRASDTLTRAHGNVSGVARALDDCAALMAASDDKDQGEVDRLLTSIARSAAGLKEVILMLSGQYGLVASYLSRASGSTDGQAFTEAQTSLGRLSSSLEEFGRTVGSVYAQAVDAAAR